MQTNCGKWVSRNGIGKTKKQKPEFLLDRTVQKVVLGPGVSPASNGPANRRAQRRKPTSGAKGS